MDQFLGKQALKLTALPVGTQFFFEVNKSVAVAWG
jgi:hypothetical protein